MGKSFIEHMINQKHKKHIRSLDQKKYRKKYGQFLIEGLRLVESALLLDADIIELFWTPSIEERHPTFVEKVLEKGLNVNRVSEKEIQEISMTESPSGIVAICALPSLEFANLSSQKNWLYLDSIADPGNLGTILRNASWFNICNIALSQGCVDAFNPKVLRSGMGAHFSLHIYSDFEFSNFQKSQHTLVGTDTKGEAISTLSDIPKPWVLVLGGEANGLQKETQTRLDLLLSIPKIGKGESLNVASACAVFLYAMTKS